MKQFNQRIKLPEMARLLSRSSKQFRADVSTYRIPHIQLGRNKLFDPEEVERYLIQNSQTSAAPSPAESGSIRSTKPSRIAKSDPTQSNRYQTLLGLV